MNKGYIKKSLNLNSVEFLKRLRNENRYPILGICLGHQAIAHAFGGEVVYAKNIQHGKSSWIHHSQDGIFEGIPSPMQVGRYHSLAVRIQNNFKITFC